MAHKKGAPKRPLVIPRQAGDSFVVRNPSAHALVVDVLEAS